MWGGGGPSLEALEATQVQILAALTSLDGEVRKLRSDLTTNERWHGSTRNSRRSSEGRRSDDRWSHEEDESLAEARPSLTVNFCKSVFESFSRPQLGGPEVLKVDAADDENDTCVTMAIARASERDRRSERRSSHGPDAAPMAQRSHHNRRSIQPLEEAALTRTLQSIVTSEAKPDFHRDPVSVASSASIGSGAACAGNGRLARDVIMAAEKHAAASSSKTGPPLAPPRNTAAMAHRAAGRACPPRSRPLASPQACGRPSTSYPAAGAPRSPAPGGLARSRSRARMPTMPWRRSATERRSSEREEEDEGRGGGDGGGIGRRWAGRGGRRDSASVANMALQDQTLASSVHQLQRHSRWQTWHRQHSSTGWRDLNGRLNHVKASVGGVVASACARLGDVLDRCLPMLRPGSGAQRTWGALRLLLLLYIAVVAPLQAAFAESLFQRHAAAWAYTNVVVDGLFLLDVLVPFRVAVWKDGRLVRDSAWIAKRYVHSTLLANLIVACPYSWCVRPAGTSAAGMGHTLSGHFYAPTDDLAVELVRLLRLLRPTLELVRGMTGDERAGGGGGGGGAAQLRSLRTAFFRFNPGVWRVLQLLLLLFCSSHWLGCIWWLSCTTERQWGLEPNSWHPPPEAFNSTDISLQYAHSFLFGLSIISNLMPYDVRPITPLQVGLTTLATLYGLFISVVIISSATAALHALDAKRELGRQRLEKLTAYLSLKSVPEALTGKIVEFFEFEMTSTRSIGRLSELEELPYSLRMQLDIELHKGLITMCPIFQQLPEQAILSLLRKLRPEVYPPATLLIQEGMRNSRLYFISEGVVEVWRAFDVVQQKRLLATLRKNNFFGEFSLMNGGRANATVATVSFCDLLILTSEDFDDVLLVYLSRAGPEAITHDLEA